MTDDKPELFIWKFIIPPRVWVKDPENPDLSYSGCVAAAVAFTEDQARTNLKNFAASQGLDARWLRAARVVQLPLATGTIVSWAQE